jgi:hypothetical protein
MHVLAMCIIPEGKLSEPLMTRTCALSFHPLPVSISLPHYKLPTTNSPAQAAAHALVLPPPHSLRARTRTRTRTRIRTGARTLTRKPARAPGSMRRLAAGEGPGPRPRGCPPLAPARVSRQDAGPAAAAARALASGAGGSWRGCYCGRAAGKGGRGPGGRWAGAGRREMGNPPPADRAGLAP